MTRQLGTPAILVLATALAVGCASAGGGSTGLTSRHFQQDVGNATARDVERRTPRILERYHYVIVRHETSERRTYIETDWRTRTPFEDEVARGISSVRSRIIVRARQRGGATGSTALMVVTFTMENLALDEESGQWRQAVVTDMFTAYAKRIANRLKDEFTSGIRVF